MLNGVCVLELDELLVEETTPDKIFPHIAAEDEEQEVRKHIYEASLRSSAVASWRQHLRNTHVTKLLSDAQARQT
jgi:heat shock protein HspQ